MQAIGGSPLETSCALLQQVVNKAVAAACCTFNNLHEDELAITVIDATDKPRSAAHRGEARIYPASVVKLFYLVATHAWLQQKQLSDTPELQRALTEMIVNSSNDATHYILDLLTETTGGPELAPDAMHLWAEKRNAVNRYFHPRGFSEINVNQKTWSEGPFGREKVFMTSGNRNALTTDATAKLLLTIAQHQCVSATASGQMLELLNRDPIAEAAKTFADQHSFISPALPPGSRLFSKAGWTSQARHDAAYFTLPNGKKIILVIFTVNHSANPQLIPRLATLLVSAMT